MTPQDAPSAEYDTVELRTGRLFRIRRAEARMLGEEDHMAEVVKCYCRTHDILTAEDAELQKRPAFVFPAKYFKNLESLIGKELQGRLYSDSERRRIKFYLDLKEHAGFHLEEDGGDLESPWYDNNALKE